MNTRQRVGKGASNQLPMKTIPKKIAKSMVGKSNQRILRVRSGHAGRVSLRPSDDTYLAGVRCGSPAALLRARASSSGTGSRRLGSGQPARPPAWIWARQRRARLAASLDGLDELWQHLGDIADNAQVGDGEDRSLPVLVDGDDVLGALHTDHVLSRPRDPARDVDRRLHRLAGLADLK